jgi:hypothetical protein
VADLTIDPHGVDRAKVALGGAQEAHPG